MDFIEEIHENYWEGTYKEYNVIIRKTDSFINASNLCYQHKLSFSRYLEGIGKKNIPLIKNRLKIEPIDKSICHGGLNGVEKEINFKIKGTYVHIEVIDDVILWILKQRDKKENIDLKLYMFGLTIDKDKQYFKIGSTSLTPEERLYQYQCPLYYIKMVWKIKNISDEKFVHQMLEKDDITREWFKLLDVEKTIKDIDEYFDRYDKK